MDLFENSDKQFVKATMDASARNKLLLKLIWGRSSGVAICIVQSLLAAIVLLLTISEGTIDSALLPYIAFFLVQLNSLALGIIVVDLQIKYLKAQEAAENGRLEISTDAVTDSPIAQSV